MIVDAADAARVEHLEDLPILVPDPARADRARRRCRALLARQRRRGDRVARRADTARRGVVRVIVATVCVLFVVYLTALVATAIRVRAGV
jgi:hypothetical protein